MFEDYSVRVGRDSLFGRRIKVVRSGIIFIRGSEVDWMLLEASEDGSLAHQPVELIGLHHTRTVLNVPDYLSSSLFKTKVQVSTPETHVVTVKYLVTLFKWKQFWKIEHGGDFLKVLHPILDILLVRRQVRVDKEQGRPEEDEAHRHRTLGLELGPGPRTKAVIFRDAAIPDQVTADEDREVKGSETGRVEEDVTWAKSVLQPHLPFRLLGERLLGSDHEEVRHVLDVGREQELGEVSGRHLAVHVPRTDKDPELPITELPLELLRPEQGGGTHRAHQVRPLPRLAHLQRLRQEVVAF